MIPPHDDAQDFELIRRMAEKATDFPGARDAWGRFYVRHHRPVLGICASDHGYLLGIEEVKDLVQSAFVRAFPAAATFDYAEICEPAVQEYKSRAWLVRIVENLIRSRFRGQPEICLVDDSEIERLGGTTQQELGDIQAPECERLMLLKSAFALLSETEQTILRATMFWWQVGQQQQRMPQAALAQLSRQTNKSPENTTSERSASWPVMTSHMPTRLELGARRSLSCQSGAGTRPLPRRGPSKIRCTLWRQVTIIRHTS
jgi:RNA polymerase sigma factor (sigma-70 family)